MVAPGTGRTMIDVFGYRAMQAGFLWADAWRDAGATIAMRLPVLAAAAGGDARAQRATYGMVEEKLTAASQGSVAAAHAILDLQLRFMTGRLTRAQQAAAPLDLMLRATSPARKRVRRNARSLTRRV